MARFRDWSLVIAAGSLMMLMAYIGWLTLIDGTIYKPVLEFGVRFNNIFPTEKEFYKPGEEVKLRMIIHKNRNINGKAYWRLIDSKVTVFPCQDASLPFGVHDKITPIITIPMGTPAGEYYLACLVEYKVNWLRTISYAIYSQRFKVINKYADKVNEDLKNCPDPMDVEKLK